MWAVRHLAKAAVRRGHLHRQTLATNNWCRELCGGVGRNKQLVIFDKDGTLVTFEDTWIDWTISMTEKYAEKVQKPIHKELYDVLGFNAQTRRFRDGLICEPDDVIILTLSSYLQSHGLSVKEAQEFVEENYFCYESSEHKTVPIDDPKALFTELKSHGLKIAVCTSDSALGKDAMVRDLELDGLCDFSLCGDEEEMLPKPDAQNIHHICDRLGIAARDTVMVGDAVRDMEMGRNANVALSVGVLSGVCDEEHLAHVADVIVPSVKHILPLVIPGYHKE